MKKVYLLISLFFVQLSFHAQAQDLPNLGDLLGNQSELLNGVLSQDTNGERYRDPVFKTVLLTPSIPYGSAEVVFGETSIPLNIYPLALDLYQPAGDIGAEKRPLIILAFGGAFVYGARVSPDIVQLALRYAQLGYVVASIDYRLSDELILQPTPQIAVRAVGKAMHDMRASVRFFRRQADQLFNVLNIDTNQIFVGGVSAGAFAALHTAYLDRLEELPDDLRPSLEDLGGIDGNSGNPGYSSAVAGVINLCGALGEADWLEEGDAPLVSMHGTDDGTVPYDGDTIRVLGINYPVDGSAAIKRHSDRIGHKHDFYTWQGADHTPFVLPTLIGPSEMAYLDTAFWFTRDFLFEQVQQNSVSIAENKAGEDAFVLYPNPSMGEVSIRFDSKKKARVSLYNTLGQNVFEANIGSGELIDLKTLKKGVYRAELESTTGLIRRALVLE